MKKITSFLWLCSGSNKRLLNKCETEAAKYAGIGATILFTGLFASAVAIYAIYMISDNYWVSILFGLFWGLLIFNLDRFIVSSMRKSESGSSEWKMAAPRFVLAAMIALVISKPLELKIFETEINSEIALMEEEISEGKKQRIISDYQKRISLIKSDIKTLDDQVLEYEKIRDKLAAAAIAEADGSGGTMKRNAGPIYKIKKADSDRANQELNAIKERNFPLITNQQNNLTNTQKEMQVALANINGTRYNGIAARLEALSRLSDRSSAILIANWFIMILFIIIESAPVLVKIMSGRGPYDYLLEQEEHRFSYNWVQYITSSSARARKKSEELPMQERQFVEDSLITQAK